VAIVESQQGILRMTAKNPFYPLECGNFCTRILTKVLTSEITRDRTTVTVTCVSRKIFFILPALRSHSPSSGVFSIAEPNSGCVMEQVTLVKELRCQRLFCDGERQLRDHSRPRSSAASHNSKFECLPTAYDSRSGLFELLSTHGRFIKH
jgi:hypothetical protein